MPEDTRMTKMHCPTCMKVGQVFATSSCKDLDGKETVSAECGHCKAELIITIADIKTMSADEFFKLNEHVSS